MLLFALIALAPVPLLLAATFWGGLWAWAAFAYVTVLAVGVDMVIRRVSPAMEPDAVQGAANTLSVALVMGHFAVLWLGIAALADEGLTLGARIALFIAAGLFFGQVSNSNAHELIHRRAPVLRALGVAVYTSLLFGHHASAHPKIHHRYAASDLDPNSAREGESFYTFARRAWLGSFMAGFRAEAEGNGLNPYYIYIFGAAVVIALAGFGAGAMGILALFLLAAYAQMQLLLSDYIQHFGLRRGTLPDGTLAPLTMQHSWNAPHFFTSFLMLNAPRHSDHHANGSRPYPALRMPAPGEAPILPHSLPFMAVIALFPPLWRKVMQRELALWRATQ